MPARLAKFWLRLRALGSTARVVLLIQDGRIEVLRGKLPPRLRQALADTAEEFQIESGCIHAWESSAGLRLEFTSLPERYHQRFRNIWLANQ